jgi:hypothetical protein
MAASAADAFPIIAIPLLLEAFCILRVSFDASGAANQLYDY